MQARVKFHVLLTSNEMVKREATELRKLRWECMIVDEGHRLKQKGELFGQLASLDTQHRVLLTGEAPSLTLSQPAFPSLLAFSPLHCTHQSNPIKGINIRQGDVLR